MVSNVNEFYHKHNEIHAHNTRNKENFLISRGTDNPVSMSARVWNALVTKININVTLPIFKKTLKLYLLLNCLELKYSR